MALSFTELNDLYNTRMWRYVDCLNWFEWQLRADLAGCRRGASIHIPVCANMSFTIQAHPEYLDQIAQEFQDANWYVRQYVNRQNSPTLEIQRK